MSNETRITETERIDAALRGQAVVRQLASLFFTYVSFRKSPIPVMLKQLHWTHLKNRQVKYEILYNVSVDTLTLNKGTQKIESLRSTLMKVLHPSGGQLFVGVEQGRTQSNSSNVFVLFYPSVREEVIKWLETQWGKQIVV